MKKERLTFLNGMGYLLVIIGTIASLFIVYKDISSKIAIRFVIVNVIFLILFFLYQVFMVIFNVRKISKREVKKRLLRFFCILIVLGMSSYGIDYFFRPLKADIIRSFTIALGLAFGISFSDLVISTNNLDKDNII